MDKAEVVQLFIAALERDLEAAEAAAAAAREGATHEEAKPENQYDTRGLEQSYLAGAQAARVTELAQALAKAKAMDTRPRGEGAPVSLGALVRVDTGEEEAWLLFAADGGGLSLKPSSGETVRVSTSKAPVGRALLGKRVGEGAELKVAGKERAYEILEIL